MFKTYLLTIAMTIALSMSGKVQAGNSCGLFPCGAGCETCSGSGCGGSCDTGCASCCSPSCDGGCDSGCGGTGCSSCAAYGSCCFGDLLQGCCAGEFQFHKGCFARYTSLFGAYNSLHDYSGGASNPGPTSGSFSHGWGIGIAQGRRITNSLRGEFEFSFRSNTGDKWRVNGATGDWSGHVFNYIGMSNLFLDLNLLSCHGTTPYLGAGIGFDVVDGKFQTGLTRVEIEDVALAYQFIAGASKQVKMNVDLFAEYRYVATSNLDVYNTGVSPKELLDSTPGEMESVLFGIRFFR